MSKNLTRKGLAFGAVVALSTTLIAGSPAFASDTVTLTPSAGTTYSTLLGSPFTLSSSVGLVAQSVISNSQIKWNVTNADAKTVSVKFSTGANAPAFVKAATSTAAAATGAYSSAATAFVFQPWTNVDAAQNAVAADEAAVNNIQFSTNSETTTTITVQAFLDVNNTGALDSGDTVSDLRTVKFVKGSDVTSTLALTDPIATATAEATVTLGNDINIQQLAAGDVAAQFIVDGGNSTLDATAALNTAKTALVFDGAAITAGQVIGVKSRITRYAGDTTYTVSSVVSKSVLAASSATTAALTLANSADIATGAGTFANSTVNLNKLVRAGVKSVSFGVAFTDVDALAVAAGQPVTVTVEEVSVNALAAGTVITAGGKELKNSDATTIQTVSYNALTDAAGKVSVTIASDDATAADHILVTVTANTGTAEVALLWATPAATTLVETATPLGFPTRVIAKDTSVALAYSMVDQFGALFSKADYNYRVALTSTAGAITVSQPFANFAAGIATATVLENDPADAAFNVVATLQSQTGTGAWAAVGGASNIATSLVTVVSALAVPASNTLATVLDADNTALATDGLVLFATKDLAAIDRRVDANTKAAIGFAATGGAKLTGVVRQADNSVAAGVAVTISATGLAFSTDATGSTYVKLDSITVYTDAAGSYTVYAFGKKAGAITVTHTAGSVVKTQTVSFQTAVATAGSVLVVDAAATVAAGRTLPVVVTLTDKYGNVVDTATGDAKVSVTVAGPGFATTIADHTDANGQIKFNVVLGAYDAGTVVVTAKYDSNGVATNDATTTAVTATKSTLVGAAAVVAPTSGAVIASKNGRVYVTVNSPAGFKSYVKVGFSVKPAFTTTGSKLVSYFVGSGKRVAVVVFVRGGKVASQAITIK